MIHAELKGKISFSGVEESDVREIERMEDLLTSDVFGILKNLSAEAWAPLLPAELVEDLRSSAFAVEFWPRYAGDGTAASLPKVVQKTEPDLVIETNRYLAIIEVKYLSSFGRSTGESGHQLLREWKLGSEIARARDKQFHLLTLTPFAPSVEAEVRSLFSHGEVGSRVHVRYWEDVYQGLQSVAQNEHRTTEGRFLSDLVEYLRLKGFDAEKVSDEKQRSLAYYFGDEDAERFLSELKEIVDPFDSAAEVLTIPLGPLSADGLEKLGNAFTILYESPAVSRSPLTNTIDEEKSILPNFLLETEDKAISDFFYRVLSEAYYLPYLRLNGRHDFSVKARIRTRGNREISLFTVRSRDATLSIQLRR